MFRTLPSSLLRNIDRPRRPLLDKRNDHVALWLPSHVIKGGITYRIIADHLGSPSLLVNVADGSLTHRVDYDAIRQCTRRHKSWLSGGDRMNEKGETNMATVTFQEAQAKL